METNGATIFLEKTKDQFIIDSNKIHSNKYDYSKIEYIGLYSKVEIICSIHGSFLQKPAHHLRGCGCGCGCQICSESIGEKLIVKVFTIYNIEFERQKRFDDCRGNRFPLAFDFFLPKYNVLIEFNGQCYYKNIYGQKSLDDTKKRDSIKNIWVRQKGIKLLRIPYWRRSEIEMLILEFIKSP